MISEKQKNLGTGCSCIPYPLDSTQLVVLLWQTEVSARYFSG